MKNSFSNFIKIILIIISIVLVIWLVFFLITRNEYSQNHQTPSQTTPDNNISIIEEELTKPKGTRSSELLQALYAIKLQVCP